MRFTSAVEGFWETSLTFRQNVSYICREPLHLSLSSTLRRILFIIALTPLFFKAAIAKACTSPPQRTMSSTPSATTDSCPVRKGLIEPFILTSSQPQLSPRPTGKVAGLRITELPRYHVPINTPITDKSNPPTSGSHYDCTATWGIYQEAPADGFLVHNLEHGNVIISYNPRRINGQTLEQLRAQARELSLSNARLILTPRPNLDAAIALTAWGYLQKLNYYNPARVKAFFDAHVSRGPECENGKCPEW